MSVKAFFASIAMPCVKAIFALAVAVLYGVWAWGAWSVWHALPWWAFFLVVMFYLPPATWLLFLAGMALVRADKEAHALPDLAHFLEVLVYPLAIVHNAANNVLPMFILFGFDPPRELATTMRLDRYADGPEGWRRRLALAIRAQLLNVFDYRGTHT
jgi:hypothetical protein